MLVRAARADEAEYLTELALHSKAHWGYDEAFIEACRTELTIRAAEVAPRRIHLAESDGRVVGFTSVQGEPPEGELGMMFVDPEFIGQGVGRLLFEQALTVAEAAGFVRLTIGSDPHAEPFYRAMGARRFGTTPSGSIPGRVLPLLDITLGTPAARG